MSGKLSIAGVALGMWLLTLMLVGGCGLGQPAPTPTAPPPTPTTPPVVVSPTVPRVASPVAVSSPSPSPAPGAAAVSSPTGGGRWTTNTILVIVDPDKGTENAGVRLRSRPALGEDERALTLYDGNEVRVVNANPERVQGSGQSFEFWQVRVESGDPGAVGKEGWVAANFLRAR